MAALTPNTWVMEMSRANPSSREIMVMLLNESTPRSRLGWRFMRRTSATADRSSQD
ncbi:MAG: hypothetical protein V4567_10225 [Pseudomonadota bacterium]